MSNINNLNRKDKTIIQHLLTNSRASYREIAGNRYSESTIKRRIDKLVRKGTIRFTIEVVGELKNDFFFQGFVLIATDFNYEGYIILDIKKIKGIKMIYEITGKYDLIAHIATSSISDLRDIINQLRNLEGIKDMDSIVVLRKIDPNIKNDV